MRRRLFISALAAICLVFASGVAVGVVGRRALWPTKFGSVLVEELDLTLDQRFKLQQIWGEVARSRSYFSRCAGVSTFRVCSSAAATRSRLPSSSPCIRSSSRCWIRANCVRCSGVSNWSMACHRSASAFSISDMGTGVWCSATSLQIR